MWLAPRPGAGDLVVAAGAAHQAAQHAAVGSNVRASPSTAPSTTARSSACASGRGRGTRPLPASSPRSRASGRRGRAPPWSRSGRTASRRDLRAAAHLGDREAIPSQVDDHLDAGGDRPARANSRLRFWRGGCGTAGSQRQRNPKFYYNRIRIQVRNRRRALEQRGAGPRRRRRDRRPGDDDRVAPARDRRPSLGVQPQWDVYGVGIIEPGNALRALAALGVADQAIAAGSRCRARRCSPPTGT